LSVTIIGAVVLTQGLIFVLAGALIIGLLVARQAGVEVMPWPTWLLGLHRREDLLATSSLLSGVFALVSGSGILRVRPWAWLMAMILQGTILATELASYARGNAIYLNMAVAVVIVLYLNQRDVQRAFSTAQHLADPESPRTAAADTAAAAEAQREVAHGR
jgi:hypothetical protein